MRFNARPHSLHTAVMGMLLAQLAYGSAWGQQVPVSGTVSATDGTPLAGVAVAVQGTGARTVTDGHGRYVIAAPADGMLMYSLSGYQALSEGVGGRTRIDVVMAPARGMTGAVATANIQDVSTQTELNVLKTLAGITTGLTIAASGSPGSRGTVRIRGVSSFQNNDPLYIIDGTPVHTSYLTWLNPDDIAAIQVLKDAAAGAVYGVRAGNGVIVIQTRHGGRRAGPARATLDVRTGVATPVKGYSDVLMTNALDYFEFVRQGYRNAGFSVPTNIYGNDSLGNNPSVPRYIWPNNCSPNPCANVDTSTYSYPDTLIMPGSPGTDWWGAVFHPALVGDYNLSVAGGDERGAYNVSFNYLDQQGTARYSRFQRGSVRSNTGLTWERLSIGERVALSRAQGHGGIDDGDLGEGNIIGKNMFEQPVIPIYDIRGNFASGKAAGLGNLTNPFKLAYEGRNNVSKSDRMFGAGFAALDAGAGVLLRSALGLDLGRQSFRGYSPAFPENSEPTLVNVINENHERSTNWTWTNTLAYSQAWGRNTLNVLLGQEANKNTSHIESWSCAILPITAVDSCDQPTSMTRSGVTWSLLSFFGEADYDFARRYVLHATLRRDGSTSLGPGRTWGTFSGFGVAWQLTNEPFLPPGRVVSSLRLRFGWGITGNPGVPAGRIVSQVGGGTFYDLGGSLPTIRPGYLPVAAGDSGLKLEQGRSENIGLDMALFRSRGTVSVDLYRRTTDNVLFDPRTPGTAGTATPRLINAGKMTNRGIELALGLRGGAETQWSVHFNGSHYRNEIVRIDEQGDSLFFGPYSLRGQNPVINKVGYPIGAFYGLVADGYYADSGDAAPYWNSGARPGRIKFRDLNGDGIITAPDRAIIGSPHPDLTAGLDFNVRRGAWDVSATLFGSFGNQIFNAQKYWEVFGYFDTNVRKDLLTNSAVLDGPCSGSACPGKVTNPNAKYPRIDKSDLFSRQFSSYWVEDGSYARLRTIQLGCNLPSHLIRWLAVARVYVQAENLLTLTGYSGLDPALPAWSATGAAGDIRDQFQGVDEGSYPGSRTFSVGISTSF